MEMNGDKHSGFSKGNAWRRKGVNFHEGNFDTALGRSLPKVKRKDQPLVAPKGGGGNKCRKSKNFRYLGGTSGKIGGVSSQKKPEGWGKNLGEKGPIHKSTKNRSGLLLNPLRLNRTYVGKKERERFEKAGFSR